MREGAEPTFSGQEAADVQTALRRELGLGPEQFPLEAFIGMISDEIERLRAVGRDDVWIAAHITGLTKKSVLPKQISQFYASPEARGDHG